MRGGSCVRRSVIYNQILTDFGKRCVHGGKPQDNTCRRGPEGGYGHADMCDTSGFRRGLALARWAARQRRGIHSNPASCWLPDGKWPAPSPRRCSYTPTLQGSTPCWQCEETSVAAFKRTAPWPRPCCCAFERESREREFHPEPRLRLIQHCTNRCGHRYSSGALRDGRAARRSYLCRPGRVQQHGRGEPAHRRGPVRLQHHAPNECCHRER